MNRNELEQKLSALLDEELSVAERADLEAQINHCSQTRVDHDELAAIHEAMQFALADERAAATRVVTKVRDALQQVDQPSAGSPPVVRDDTPSPLLRRLVWASSLAATLMLGFAVGSWTRDGARTGVAPNSPNSGAKTTANDASANSGGNDITPVAKLWFATGDVELQVPDKVGTFLCPTDTDVVAGSKMRTGALRKCEFRTANGTKVRLDEETEISIKSDGEFVLEQGRIWCETSGDSVSCYVSCGGGETAVQVLGQCDLEVTDGRTKLIPLRGSAEVSEGSFSCSVGVGQKLDWQEGQQPEPEQARNLMLETSWLNDILIAQEGGNRELQERARGLLAEMGYTKMRYLLEEELRSLGAPGVEPLIAFLRSESKEHQTQRHRIIAAELVRDLSNFSQIPRVVPLLDDSSPQVRFAIASGLHRLIGRHLAATPEQWSESTPELRSRWIQLHQDWLQQNSSRFGR